VLHYGLVHAENSDNPLLVAIVGWRALSDSWKGQPSLLRKLGVAFGRPV